MKQTYMIPQVDIQLIQPQSTILFASPGSDTPEPGKAPGRNEKLTKLYV